MVMEIRAIHFITSMVPLLILTRGRLLTFSQYRLALNSNLQKTTGNSPRHPERSEGSPANGTYLKIVLLHGDPSSQAPRDDVGSYNHWGLFTILLFWLKTVKRAISCKAEFNYNSYFMKQNQLCLNH